MSDLVVKKEVLDIEIYSKEDCILNIVKHGYKRNEWIYKASKLPDNEYKEILEEVSKIEGRKLDPSSVSYIIRSEEIKNILSLELIQDLNKTEFEALGNMTYGASTGLKGDAEGAILNFIEIMRASETTPTSDGISVYNALYGIAKNGEEIEMIPPIFKHLINGSSRLRRGFKKQNGARYTITQLNDLLPLDADEAVMGRKSLISRQEKKYLYNALNIPFTKYELSKIVSLYNKKDKKLKLFNVSDAVLKHIVDRKTDKYGMDVIKQIREVL